mmetsp:Transcript_17957/g.55239  ORF Transcript_17957/g.55239 Transcript_17957/m.55239 type:complete len:109 (-) Transcript_17957:28-354(-)
MRPAREKEAAWRVEPPEADEEAAEPARRPGNRRPRHGGLLDHLPPRVRVHRPRVRGRVAPDARGHERAAITQWLEDNDTSPETNLVLDNKHLTPNIALRKAIAHFTAS